MAKIKSLTEYESRQAKFDWFLEEKLRPARDNVLKYEALGHEWAIGARVEYDKIVKLVEDEQRTLWQYRQENPWTSFRPWDQHAKLWDGMQWRPCHNPSLCPPFDDWKSGKERFLLISGATRSGKTFGVGARVVIDDLLSAPGRTVCVIGETFDQICDDVQSALWTLRPTSELWKKQREWSPGDGFGKDGPTFVVQKQDWHFRQMSRGIFRTYTQGIERIQGLTLNGLWFNEPPPNIDWIMEAQSRIATTNGWILVTATFLYMNEVWNRLTSSEFGFKIYRLKQIDNPAIDKAEVERKRKIMTPAEFGAWCEGEPMNLGGRCYGEFKNDWPWVVDWRDVPPPQKMEYHELIDWHDSKPIAWQRWGVDERGEGWCIGEIWHGGLITDLAREIWNARMGRPLSEDEWRDLEARRYRCPASERWRMPGRLVFDSASKEQAHRVGESDKEQLERMLGCGSFLPAQRMQYGPRVRMVNEELAGRWNHRLDEAPKGGGEEGGRSLLHFVKGACPMTIDQMGKVGWEIYQTAQAREAKGVTKERKQQRDEDFTDLVDYFVTVGRGKFVGENERRARDNERRIKRIMKQQAGESPGRIRAKPISLKRR